MAKATLINSAGKKVVVETGSADAQKYFGEGYQLMGTSGKYAAPGSAAPSTNVSTGTKATLINSAGNKVVVESGSQQAQQYFGQGYKLATEADLNATINANQDSDMAKKEGEISGTPDKSAAQKKMEEIKTEVTPTDVTKPTRVGMEETYTTLREKYGLGDLETNLTDLQNQEEELLSKQRDRKDYAETGDTSQVALGVIGGRESEIDRQTNKQLTEIRRQQNYITNQLKTKYDIISNLMSLKQTDYANALSEYNTAYQNNLTLLNMVNTETTKEENNARADFSTMISALNENGVSIDSLSPTQKATLTKLEVAAGMTPGSYEALLKATAGSKLTSLGVDNNTSGGRSAYFLSVDPKTNTPKVISFALPGARATKTGSGSDTTDEDKSITKFRDSAAELIGKIDSGDTSWGTAWQQLHVKFPDASSELIDQTLGGGYNQNTKEWWGRAAQ